jgi:hypothetical protein
MHNAPAVALPPGPAKTGNRTLSISRNGVFRPKSSILIVAISGPELLTKIPFLAGPPGGHKLLSLIGLSYCII